MADVIQTIVPLPTTIQVNIPVGARGLPGADGQAQLAAHEAALNPHPQYLSVLAEYTLTFGDIPVFPLGLIKGVIGEVRVNVLVPFNDSAASFSVGDATNQQRLMSVDEVVLDQTGVSSTNPSVDFGTAGVQINAYINAGQATTGKLKIVIYEG